MKEGMKEKGRKEDRVFSDLCQSFIKEFLYFKEQAGSSQDCRAAGREGQRNTQRTLVTIHIESLPQSSCSQTLEHKLLVTKLLLSQRFEEKQYIFTPVLEDLKTQGTYEILKNALATTVFSQIFGTIFSFCWHFVNLGLKRKCHGKCF